ncbi:MAG: hypothetical protein N3C12_09610 [Candidatus Binatia bacterium]|nr:hypothetical protein [Candidatus Binatia bacterium]
MIFIHNHSTLPPETASSLADVIRAQEEAGCTIVTDGFYSARDPVWLAIECVGGVEPGTPADYFGASFSVPTPVVRDHLHYQAAAAVERWRAAQSETERPVKAVLPGPLTLALLSDYARSPYHDRESLAEAWATALLPEFTALVAAGAKWIQLDEPAILRMPDAVRLLRDLLQPFWDSREHATLLVSTWGAETEEMYAQLHSLPTDIIGVDVVMSPNLLDLIPEVGASQQLYLGVISPVAKNRCDDLSVKIERILHNYEFPDLHLGPAAGLQSLEPRAAIDALREIYALGRRLSPPHPTP